MDRLCQLRGGAGGSGDSTLDTSSPPSEAYESANESTSKYFSLSEVDTTFEITTIKDVSLASTTGDPEPAVTDPDELISNLSPISKKSDMLDSYKIGKQIEAANILSGGVDIFDDNDNSYDGDELVIDDNAELDEKSNSELKIAEPQFKDDNMTETTLVDSDEIASKDTEVVLQIDGKNVDAIDIGNGIYLYRKEGQEELAAVQIIDGDQQQPSFKFLKVRENAEGNLEVYEEIEIEVPKEMPSQEGKPDDKNTSHVPIKDINKVISDSSSNKVVESKNKGTQKENLTSLCESVTEMNKDITSECKAELNLNGKMMKFSESRKSPVVGSFTPMAYHSTPNKEGIPLTKTMVNQQLHPSRHSDNKKTIEVHTDISKKVFEPSKKDSLDKEESEITIDKEIQEIALEAKIEIKEDKETDKDQRVGLSKETGSTGDLKQLNQIILKNGDKTKLEETISILSGHGVGSPEKVTKFLPEVEPKSSVNAEVNKQVTEKPLSDKNLKESKVAKEKDAQILENVDIKRKDLEVNEMVTKKEPISIIKTGFISSSSEQLKAKTHIKTDKILTDCVFDHSKNYTMVLQKEIKSGDKDPKDEKKEPEVENVQTLEKVKTIENKSKAAVQEPVKTLNENDKINDLMLFKEATVNTVDKVQNNEKDVISSFEVVKEQPHNDNSLVKDKLVAMDKQPDKPKGVKNIEKEKDKMTEDRRTLKTTVDADKQKSSKLATLRLKTDQQDIDNKKIQMVKTKTTTDGKEIAQAVISVTDEKSKNIPETNIVKAQSLSQSHDKVTHNERKELIAKEKIDKVENKELITEIEQLLKIKSVKKLENSIDNAATVKKDEQIVEKKVEIMDKKDIPIAVKVEQKSLNNNHAPVPFGQWTEANKQEFLNKFKETKAPVNSSNCKQIKNSNDLNRRDVLKKIDSQRQSSNAAAAAKAQETNKASLKNETMFTNKTTILSQELKDSAKTGSSCELKEKPSDKKQIKPEAPSKVQEEKKDSTKNTVSQSEKSAAPTNSEVALKKDFFNAQDIIDITIEDMIHRNLPTKHPEESKPNIIKKNSSEKNETPYDDIEMKMNELHGIPFVERPPHELPHINDDNNVNKTEKEKVNKSTKIPSLLPYTNKISKKSIKDHLIEVDSEEEIIEHEPITGDIDINAKVSGKEADAITDTDKQETIITENDFDKFARRNSVTYENCLTVKLVGKEPHNVIQTVVEKDIPKKYSKSEMVRLDVKSKLPQKNPGGRHGAQSNRVHSMKTGTVTEDPSNKQYQSKLQIAYQSALTAKRQLECPITIIEDKPVKVVFIDSNAEYIPNPLNVQGQELSPVKKSIPEIDAVTTSTCDSLDSDVLDSTDDAKSQDESKIKNKHQRKQIFSPVQVPDLELIQPGDLGIEVSPKKKRKTEESKYDKHSKNLIHKKSYLLGRTAEDRTLNAQDLTKTSKNITNKSETFHRESVSAIDSLVKAAELLENQNGNMNTSTHTNPDSQQTTPAKRGRGRPRKYPLPEGADKNKTPSPQKKPRLIDAKLPKRDTTTEEEDSSDDEMIKENWTMGKINENIVCPICNKLFRSENVVFKHVKHCTGVSPNRSDSEKRSPTRIRQSKESESKSEDMDIDDDKPISSFSKKETPRKRKSKDSVTSYNSTMDEPIVIDDTLIKDSENKKKPEDIQETKQECNKPKTKISSVYSLVCEICGKVFRQKSYLDHHKLQHKKEEKKIEKVINAPNKSVFTCEVCKKAFRKLHHLVQHRLIHNNAPPSRALRKTSSEQQNGGIIKVQDVKQNDDPSAGFRCEPCDKSFRKLHHLVEHRETHDGINRQKSTTVPQVNVEKPTPTLECDICKKTFRKLHHLVEHKEQHNETGSDKSDDKSVISTLSTKDIIHECSLCYMVFPNEHSLNKHTVICQRKKRQSKQVKSNEESDNLVDAADTKQDDTNVEVNDNLDIPKQVEISYSIEKGESEEPPKITKPEQVDNEIEIIENPTVQIIEVKTVDAECMLPEPEVVEHKNTVVKNEEAPEKTKEEIIDKNQKIIEKEKVHDTPKKKTPLKDKVASTVTKRKKTTDLPLPVVQEVKPAVETSDDEEVRYMLNPDFKEDTPEDKLFMKVRAKKRNSLQIGRPSKDLVKRKTLLQHPPKIPRLKQKQTETKVASTSRSMLKVPKLQSVPSTDSDDSDVKYSFPETAATKPKPTQLQKIKQETKTPGKLSQKRKSLSSIAKRKSLGKVVLGRPKVKTSPEKYVKRRKTEVEHRCDCGELFSSAALLTRHTSVAHTPPRIRKRRSPPPEFGTKTVTKTTRKSTDKPKPSDSRKSSVRSGPSYANKSVTRKSSAASEVKAKSRKSDVAGASTNKSTPKPRRSAAHRGVPVPEKMRKLMQSFKK